MRFFAVSVLFMIGALATPNVAAQKTTTLHPGAGGSVHVRSEWNIAGALISIEYGRPSLKGRPLDVLAVPGRVWRLGADEATILRTSDPLLLGQSPLAAGQYSLYAIPGSAEWQLIINRQTGQWGTVYDERADVMRVPMTVSTAAEPVEQLTIAMEPGASGGLLTILWGRVRTELMVSATKRG